MREREGPAPMIKWGIKSAWLQVGRYQVHYLVSGNGQPVVLIHGWATACREWTNTMAHLYRYRRMCAPDLIGFGSTDNPLEEYALEDFTAFTEAFIAKTCQGPVALVGHSLGGRIAIEVALNAPELVSRLVLIDTNGFGRLSAAGRVLLETFDAVRRIRRQKQPHPKFCFPDPDLVCLDCLGGVTQPVLIIWGELDLYYPVGQARRAAKLFPNARLEVIRWAGHAPHRENPAKVLPIIGEFLAPGEPGNII